MRRPYIAGNWKMNLDRRRSLELVSALRDRLTGFDRADVAVCPPAVYLEEVVRALSGSNVKVGAQNVCDRDEGAFTGEVSAAMLRDVGATLTIVGHSERRHVYGETDALVNAKVERALACGLEVILCVGETLEERRAGQTEAVVDRQLTEGLKHVLAADMARVTIAYEPVWAIGTGETATPGQAGEVHDFLRRRLADLHGAEVAVDTRIQYGGSVKPGNASELMAVPDVDGALVGGASLDADSFLRIVEFDRS